MIAVSFRGEELEAIYGDTKEMCTLFTIER